MAFRLTVRIAGVAQAFALEEGRTEVGSAPGTRIVLQDPSVSRRHATLEVRGGQVDLEDLGSSNGTRLGSRRLQGRVRILPGSTLSFGAVTATLEEIAEEDLEVGFALSLGRSLAPEPPLAAALTIDPEAANAPTASLEVWGRFGHHDLPALLDSLLAIRGGEPAASPSEGFREQLGSALLRFPGCREALLREPSGSWAGSKDEDPSGEGAAANRGSHSYPAQLWAVAEEKPWSARLRFAQASSALICQPVANIALELLRLAQHSQRRPAAAAPRSPPAQPPLPNPPTQVPAVVAMLRQAARVARGSISVLIRGESGVGKEVLARYLHRASPQAKGPFVALHCGAIPEEMIEVELFGIEKGAATGVAERPGKFEEAHGGVLFLDELADLSPTTQAKLLRALEAEEVFRVGAKRPRPAKVRLISATQGDLAARVEAQRFRLDLFHRLADWVVEVPPLRRRLGDLPALAGHFLERECQRSGKGPRGISRGALEALLAYDWPGNIRQLEREMARAVLFVEAGQLLEKGHLTPEIATATSPDLATLLRREEEKILLAESAATHGDVAVMATRLGISRATVYRRLEAIRAKSAPP